MSRASEPTHPIPRPRLGCAAVERGFPWTETPSHFKGDRLHFLAEFEDFRRSRVREFLGGTASRIFFFRLDIPPYVPEKAQPLSHFLLTPDRPRGSCLGLISRNQYDRRSTPKAKPPHISEPRSWTTPPASATSWSPTTPSTDVILYAANSGTSSNIWNLWVRSVSISPLCTVDRPSRHPSMAVRNCSKSS